MLEEGVGFKPTELLHPTVFKTVALSHSANLLYVSLTGIEPASLTATDFKSVMFPNFITEIGVPLVGIEPTRLATLEPKSNVSTSSTIKALKQKTHLTSRWVNKLQKLKYSARRYTTTPYG